MPERSKFYEGQVVFDKRRPGPTDDMLVGVDANPGTLETFTGEAYRLIKHNDTNKELNAGQPVDEDEPCVTCTYISTGDHTEPEVQGETYTFPEYRLETVGSGPALDGHFPYQWALSQFFGELVRAMYTSDMTIEDADDLQVLAMQAGVDGEVILRGMQEGLGKKTAHE